MLRVKGARDHPIGMGFIYEQNKNENGGHAAKRLSLGTWFCKGSKGPRDHPTAIGISYEQNEIRTDVMNQRDFSCEHLTKGRNNHVTI